MLKRSLVLALLIFSSLFLFSDVLADGAVIPPQPPQPTIKPLEEDRQLAAITYENGLQRMVLSTSFHMEGRSGAVWITPVPSDPDETVIDVTDRFPEIEGQNIWEKAKSSIGKLMRKVRATQLYPYLFESLTKAPTAFLGAAKLKARRRAGVTIHEHLEKEGVTVEILTAKEGKALYNYLKEKGLKLEKGTIPVLDEYIGKDYSFIVAWISGAAESQTRTKTESKPAWEVSLDSFKGKPKPSVKASTDTEGYGELWLYKTFNINGSIKVSHDYKLYFTHPGSRDIYRFHVWDGEGKPCRKNKVPYQCSPKLLSTKESDYSKFFSHGGGVWSTWKSDSGTFLAKSGKVTVGFEIHDVWIGSSVAGKFDNLVLEGGEKTIKESFDEFKCEGWRKCSPSNSFCANCTNGWKIFAQDVNPDYDPSPTEIPGGRRLHRPSKRKPGVKVTFPTDKLYYPLKPTSIYGSKEVPITIYIKDFVRPKTPKLISSYLKTSYYVGKWSLPDFYEGETKYTKIKINAPSKYFKKDLWFESGMAKASYAAAILKLSERSWIVGILFILCLSSIVGGIAGWLIFGNWKKYSLIGLSNTLSVIGLAVATLIINIKGKEIGREKRKELSSKLISFLVIFSLLFLGLSFVLGFLLKIPLRI